VSAKRLLSCHEPSRVHHKSTFPSGGIHSAVESLNRQPGGRAASSKAAAEGTLQRDDLAVDSAQEFRKEGRGAV
jgi:hypothetical protein